MEKWGHRWTRFFCLGHLLIILKGCLYDDHLKEAEINKEEKVPLGVDQGSRDSSFFVMGGEVKQRTRYRCRLQTDLALSLFNCIYYFLHEI